MIEYFNHFTINDFITVYCAGMLGIFLIILSSGIIMMVGILAIDLVNAQWYSMKINKAKHQYQQKKQL